MKIEVKDPWEMPELNDCEAIIAFIRNGSDTPKLEHFQKCCSRLKGRAYRAKRQFDTVPVRLVRIGSAGTPRPTQYHS